MSVGDRLQRLDSLVFDAGPRRWLSAFLLLASATVTIAGVVAGAEGAHGLWPEPIALGLGIGTVTVVNIVRSKRREKRKP